MRRSLTTLSVLALLAAGAAAGAAADAAAHDADPAGGQQALLLSRSVLPSATFRPGSPPSGSFFTATNRSDALANGVVGPASGPYFAEQPVQGISAMVPAGGGTWWGLADNGYGTRETSADWQLALYRFDLRFGTASSPTVLETVVLSDPRRVIPWKTVCDPTSGDDLPPFSFNVLPSTPPPACGTDAAARLLTGFDFDPESMEIGKDGTFWIGDEFGPYLLHADRQGRLLEAPIPAPGTTSPQNATLDVLGGQQPTVAQSRGFESLAISPNRTRLYAMTEGAVGTDDPQELRILTFDIAKREFTGEVRRLRLEMPGAKVNLSTLTLVGGARAYPGTAPPVGTGGESAAELTAVNAHQFLVVERDSAGDGVPAPRFKKVFLLDTRGARDGHVAKSLLLDLMAVPDPHHVGGDGDFFRFPFNTIESVHVVNDHTVLVANDNNYPFSNARSRSLTNARTGPLAPDDNEFILVAINPALSVDARLLTPSTTDD
jgi:hypothetical protein